MPDEVKDHWRRMLGNVEVEFGAVYIKVVFTTDNSAVPLRSHETASTTRVGYSHWLWRRRAEWPGGWQAKLDRWLMLPLGRQSIGTHLLVSLKCAAQIRTCSESLLNAILLL